MKAVADKAAGTRSSHGPRLEKTLSLEEFQVLLSERLLDWLAARESTWLAENPAVGELTSRLSEFVGRGGKRLRPALVFFAFRGVGGRDEVAALDLGMATEMLHTYLLIHDDIMDRAEVRRGQPTAHLLFGQDHLARGWRGDSARHGEAVAILLGDLAHSYALDLFLAANAALGNETLPRIFMEMSQEVVCGQYLEMTAPFRPEWTTDDLLSVLRLKSGRYSVERPIELGATAGGASVATLESLNVYGESLGEAFQLKDDLLGIFGASDAVGKSVDSDIAEGKITVLVRQTLDSCGPQEKDLVLEALGNADASSQTLAKVREIVETSGARAHVETMIERRLEKASLALSTLDLESDAAEFFEQLIHFSRDRDH